MSEAKPEILKLTYSNDAPVELSDLTLSLQAVSRRYVRFATQLQDRPPEDEVKLFVKQITHGSIVVELIDWVGQHQILGVGTAGVVGAGVLTQCNTIASFAKNLRDSLSWLRGTGPKPDDVPTSELRDLAKIVEPVAKDRGGDLKIEAAEGATVIVSYTINSLEANAIQNRAEREIEARSEPAQKTYRQVMMYWQQASKGSSSRSDKAIIDSISEKPLKVVFDEDSQDIKNRMISGRDNPFTIAFLVDVELMTVRGRAIAYKVTRLYEVIDDGYDEQ